MVWRRTSSKESFPSAVSVTPQRTAAQKIHADLPLVVAMDAIFEARQHQLHISCIAH
jgi:hypothetical protein